MKFILIFCALACLLSTIAKADLTQDAETIFNWAEKSFPQYFPSSKTSQTLDVWHYRYYPETGIYAGANTSDSNIYVLGGEFGNVVKNVGSSQALLAMAGNSTSNNIGPCVKINFPVKGLRTFTEDTTKGLIGLADRVTKKTEKLYIDFTATREEISQIDTNFLIGNTPLNVVNTDFVINSYINDGMLYSSSVESSMKDSRNSEDPIKSKATYNPGIIGGPIDKVCKNQTWKTNSSEQTLTTTVNGKETTKVTNIDSKHTITIEAIDDVIASSVGNFNAVRVRHESDSTVRLIWLSIEKGIEVKSITTYKNNTQVNESILTSIQYP